MKFLKKYPNFIKDQQINELYVDSDSILKMYARQCLELIKNNDISNYNLMKKHLEGMHLPDIDKLDNLVFELAVEEGLDAGHITKIIKASNILLRSSNDNL